MVVDRPIGGVPTPPTITTTAESGGYVLTCECLWVRYEPRRNDAADAQREHVKKCKGVVK
jgi:hypothetical protein